MTPCHHDFSINRPTEPFPLVRQDNLRRLNMRVRLLILFLFTLFLPHLTLAQATNGIIRGAVTDPNAAVSVKNVATGFERRLTTGGEGTYHADNLPPGAYEIQVESQGFQKQLKRATVQTGNSAEANFSMTVGASAETVVITSAVGQVNASDYKIDGVITRERIENLPLNGRSFLSLASLEPGVAVAYDANPGAGGPNNYFRVAIARATSTVTRISVDGA